MKVIVEEYDPIWKEQFRGIKQELEETLATNSPYLSIEHVGSTSVPYLAAKPVIDIDIVVQHQQLEAVITALETRGAYVYVGECGIPERHAFKFREPAAKPSRNLYCCIKGSQALRNHLAVRDICTRDKDVRDAYASKKLELSKLDWTDVDAYAEAKTEVLQWVLAQAGFAAQDMNDIRQHNTRPSLT